MKHVAPSFLLPVFFAVAAPAVLPGPVSPTAGIPADQFLSEPEPVPFVSDDGAWCDVAVVDGLTWAYAVVGGAGNESARVGVFARIRAVPTSAAGHVAIPHSFEGAPVTAIDGMAFYGCDRLVSVVVPDGVESIGDYAFYGCTALESVSLPESATNIAATAFEGCPLLSSSASPDRFRAAPSAAPPENKDGPDAENAVCVVSFDANGGSVDVSTAEYPAGEVLGRLPVPVREGHVFDGWYDSPIPGMGSLVTTQTVAPGIVLSLFARWSLPDTDPWQPVFRFYSKNYKGHFYTMDPAESATLMCTNPNWKYEGVAYYAAKTQLAGTVPLYRFYSKNYRGHFYTIDEEEMQTVRDTNPNWNYEGIAFFVYPDGNSAPNGTATPVFRFWSKVYRHHFYTISETEMQTIRDMNPNWKYENIAFWTEAAPPEILRYDVVFDGNGATSGATAPFSAVVGRLSTLPENGFVRPGWSFAGWATNATGRAVWQPGETIQLDLASRAGEIATLYAAWTGDPYTVAFDANAAAATGTMDPQTFFFGEAQSLRRNAFALPGHAFVGWATMPEGLAVYEDGQSVVDLASVSQSVVTLHAKWSAVSFRVRFNANGGSGAMSDQVFVYGTAQDLAANAFSFDGHVFAGWATSPTGLKVYDDRQSVSNLVATAGETMDLYAKWTANEYSVRFNKNAPDATGSMSNESFVYGAAKALTANAFSRAGYTFAGWATSATGAKVYNDKQSVSNLTATHGATVDLYAVWTANGYSVKFNGNTTGTTGSMSNESFTYGVAKALTANAFAKTGYRFAGWARTAAGAKAFNDKQTVSNLTATAGAVVNLYALWSTNAYTVRFNKNASDATGTMANQTFAYDRASALRANSFARTDYTFAGWATSPTGAKVYNDKQSVSNLTATHGATVDLYAVWTCNSLYAVIDLSAGSSASSYPVTYLSSPPSGGFNTDEYKTKKLVLRRIEPGSFKMRGSVNVTLTKPFYIGLFEVTQKQYQLVTGSNPAKFQGDKRPVEYVSYNNIRGTSNGAKWPESNAVDASSFMGKLRARTGLVCDLPTEAQWEYACRAGTTSSYNNGGSSENDLKQLGRYSGNTSDGKGGYSSYHTTVGSYLPNAWGLYDMHGNVWEWCLDWHGSITGGTDPKGPSSGTQRELRGGSDRSEASLCVSGRAASNLPYGDGGKIDNGFRLAFSP